MSGIIPHRRSVPPLFWGGRIIFLRSALTVCVLLTVGGCGRTREESARSAGKLLQETQAALREGNYQKAYESARGALKLNSEPEMDSALCENELLLGRCQRELGQYDSASASFYAAKALAHRIADKGLERRVKIAHGEFLIQMHEYEKAESLATEAATAAKFSTDPADMYLALSIARSADHELGHFPSELKVLRSMAEIDSQAFNGNTALTILVERIGAFAASGQFDSASRAISRWEAAASATHDTLSLAHAELEKARVRESLGQGDSALRSYGRTLDLLNRTPDPALRREVLLAMGHLSYREKRFDHASMYYADVLSQLHSPGEEALRELLGLQMIACEWKTFRGKPETIAPTLQKRAQGIIDECARLGFRTGAAYGSFIEGKLAERRNEPASALKSYQQALERILDVPGEDALARPFIDAFMRVDETGWFEAPLSLYCATDNVEEAFRLSEWKNLTGVARFFTAMDFTLPGDSLSRMMLDLKRRLKGLRRLDEDIVGRLQEPGGRGAENVKVLREVYSARLGEYASAVEEQAPLLGNYSWLIAGKPPSLKQLQPLLALTGALVEYVPLSDALYILVVTGDQVLIRKIPAGRRHVVSLVEEYKRLIGDPRLASWSDPAYSRADAAERLNELSSILYGLLMDPLVPLLPKGKKLYVVSPAEFSWLPVHTLRRFEDGRRTSVIEQYNVSYLSTAAELLFGLEGERPALTVVGMGHPGRTGWDVEYELNDIRAFYREAPMFFDTAATLARLSRMKIDVLHIDADAAVDTRYPDNSVLVLSDGITPLKPCDIPFGGCMRERPPQTLVFSNISAVPGNLSFYGPLAFLAGGSRTVIATFWQGERKAKKYFGEVFYTNLITGRSASESYHAAMTALAKKEEFSQIYRWGLYYQFGR